MYDISIICLIGALATTSIRRLLAKDMPAGIRCVSVLEGITKGRVYTDDPASPRWAVLQEAGFGTLYIGGEPGAGVIGELVTQLRNDSDVLYGFGPAMNMPAFPSPARVQRGLPGFLGP